jgi:hypothetical protein
MVRMILNHCSFLKCIFDWQKILYTVDLNRNPAIIGQTNRHNFQGRAYFFLIFGKQLYFA